MPTLRNVIETIKNANTAMRARPGISTEQMAALKLINDQLQEAIREENGGIDARVARRLPGNTELGEESTKIFAKLRSLMTQYSLIDENGDPMFAPAQVIVDLVDYAFGESEKLTD